VVWRFEGKWVNAVPLHIPSAFRPPTRFRDRPTPLEEGLVDVRERQAALLATERALPSLISPVLFRGRYRRSRLNIKTRLDIA